MALQTPNLLFCLKVGHFLNMLFGVCDGYAFFIKNAHLLNSFLCILLRTIFD